MQFVWQNKYIHLCHLRQHFYAFTIQNNFLFGRQTVGIGVCQTHCIWPPKYFICLTKLKSYCQMNQSFCQSNCTGHHHRDILPVHTTHECHFILLQNMTPSLEDQIIASYSQFLSWDWPLSAIHHDATANLSHLCGVSFSPIICDPDQSKKLRYGHICWFETCFHGKSSWTSQKIIKDCLPGYDFIECHPCWALLTYSFHDTFHCNRYKNVDTTNIKENDTQSFTQKGVSCENVKNEQDSRFITCNWCYGY